ncbi:MAG: hypothetical protein ACLQPD_24640 [Desulfomonilaceae bacterium]
MQKTYRVRKVIKSLRQLGLKRLSKGKGGHSVFATKEGRRVCPPLRKKEVPFAHLRTLAFILEEQGIVESGRDFIASLSND